MTPLADTHSTTTMGEKDSEEKKAGIGTGDGEEQSPSAFRAYLVSKLLFFRSMI